MAKIVYKRNKAGNRYAGSQTIQDANDIPIAQTNAKIEVTDDTKNNAETSESARLGGDKGIGEMISFQEKETFSTRSVSDFSPLTVGETEPNYSRDSVEFTKFSTFMDISITKLSAEERALKIAEFAHYGQKDQLGVPYIHHPNSVKELMTQLPQYDVLSEEDKQDARIAAQLHDVIEDTAVTLEDLRSWGVTESQLTIVEALTAHKNEPKINYYKRILAAGHVAVCVKLGDLCHNSLPERRENLAGSPSNPVKEGEPNRWSRLGKKYYKAYLALGATPPSHLQQFKP